MESIEKHIQTDKDHYKSRYKSGIKSSNKEFLLNVGNNIITHFMGNYIINIIKNLPLYMKNNVNTTINLEELEYK